MLELSDPWFWGLVAALVLLVRVVRIGPRARQVAYVAATLFLFHNQPGWPILGCLIAVATYGFVAVATVRGRAQVALHTLGMAAIFVGSQYASTLLPTVSVVQRILPLVGLPYVFLRFVHLLIEVDNGTIARPKLLEYAAYILPFHQILAGPIQRWQSFRAQMDQPVLPLDADLVLAALNRITNGFLKKAILAELLKQVAGFSFDGGIGSTWAQMDVFALYLFLDFSGYMDIVIGVGMLVGWVPPENFDWPYLSRNIIEFWTRWHITLSEWIRDYLFTPLNLTLQRGFLRGRPNLSGMICYVVSFFLVGLWHRADVQFALYGLLHGFAIVVCKLWEIGLKRALGRDGFKRYRASRVAGAFGTVLTYHYVAASCIVAFHPPREALQILLQLVGV